MREPVTQMLYFEDSQINRSLRDIHELPEKSLSRAGFQLKPDVCLGPNQNSMM